MTAAHAALTPHATRLTFEAQGTIAENYGFEDFGPTGGTTSPGDPFTAHGVTYTSTGNLIAHPDAGFGNPSNVIVYNLWTPLPGSISGTYDMFGFDLSILSLQTPDTSPVDISLTTNVATYDFTGVVVPNGSTAMTFLGFTASPGEFFTGFNFVSQFGQNWAPALDNVTLGTQGVAAIPEPSTYALMLAGLGFVAWGARRRRTRSN
jgi:hypothetical protein